MTRKWLAGLAVAFVVACSTAVAQTAPKVLRVVPSADPAELDPTKGMNLIARIYSQMVFDTLFALDSHLVPRPMMVESRTSQRRRPYLYLHAAVRAEVPRRQPDHLARRGSVLATLDERRVDGTATQGTHGVARRGGRPDVPAGPEAALRTGGVHAGRPWCADRRHHARGRREAPAGHATDGAHRLRPVPLCCQRARIGTPRGVREVPGLPAAQ